MKLSVLTSFLIEVTSGTQGVNLPARRQQGRLLSQVGDRRVYFVHSYRAMPSPENADWVLATSHYGEDFISAVQKGEVSATQFHPEKSGAAGLAVIQSFMEESPQYIPPSSNGQCPFTATLCSPA